MNLQLLTLEEAFIKLEMNSDFDFNQTLTLTETKESKIQIPQAFCSSRERTFKDQLHAILLQRLYRFKEDLKEKWTLFLCIIIFASCSIWYLQTAGSFENNVNFSPTQIIFTKLILE